MTDVQTIHLLMIQLDMMFKKFVCVDNHVYISYMACLTLISSWSECFPTGNASVHNISYVNTAIPYWKEKCNILTLITRPTPLATPLNHSSCQAYFKENKKSL